MSQPRFILPQFVNHRRRMEEKKTYTNISHGSFPLKCNVLSIDRCDDGSIKGFSSLGWLISYITGHKCLADMQWLVPGRNFPECVVTCYQEFFFREISWKCSPEVPWISKNSLRNSKLCWNVRIWFVSPWWKTIAWSETINELKLLTLSSNKLRDLWTPNSNHISS